MNPFLRTWLPVSPKSSAILWSMSPIEKSHALLLSFFCCLSWKEAPILLLKKWIFLLGEFFCEREPQNIPLNWSICLPFISSTFLHYTSILGNKGLSLRVCFFERSVWELQRELFLEIERLELLDLFILSLEYRLSWELILLKIL